MGRATTEPRVSKVRNASRPGPLAGRREKRGDDCTCVRGPRSELSQRGALWGAVPSPRRRAHPRRLASIAAATRASGTPSAAASARMVPR